AARRPKSVKPTEPGIVRVVAAPILRLKFDLKRRVKILDSAIGERHAGKYLLPARDLGTDATLQIALPADVLQILENAYPDRGYIGRSFQIVKHRYVSESQAYSKRAAYSIDEIDPEMWCRSRPCKPAP
ncbi:MAG: hypothetical protein ACYDDA_03855, partial [Acidiferrobacteraceae bacterium]